MTSSAAIQFAPLVPFPVLFGLGLIGLGLLAIGVYRRAAGSIFRFLFLCVMLLALADPRIVNEQREPQPDEALILIDRTSSQKSGDRLKQTSDAEEALIAAMDDQPNLDLRIVEVTDSPTDDRPGTRLMEALATASAEISPHRFAGAVIITDGQVHDLPKEFTDGKTAGIRGPLHVLLTGKRNEIDRRLVIKNAPGYGIVGKDVTVTYRIEDRHATSGGITGRPSAKVEFKIDGAEPQTALVPVGEDQTFTFKLEHAGPSLAEIAVSAAEGELSTVNNRALVSVNGVRDRLRVLLVSGQPHAAERTWRNLLKSDPSVDLVHFTILRPPDKDDFTPLNELALIAFPTHELFVERLDEFDLIVFDRYLKRGVLQAQHLANIAERVRQGGALLMAVGPEFASRASLYYSPLRDILPAAPTGDVLESGFRPKVSDKGLRHPVTAALVRPGADPKTEPTWGRWYRQIPGDATAGVPLMTGLQEQPILLLDRIGKGRVAQVMSDHIWLWARGYDGGGPQGELLRRLAHWLMREPDLEEESLQARVRGGKLTVERRTLKDTVDKVTVTAPSGEVQELELKNAAPGLWRGELAAAEIGLYRLSDGEHRALVASGELNPLELSDLRATEAVLKPVTEATGGSVRWLADGIPDVRRVDPGRDLAGRGWVGLVSHKAYVVTGLKDIPLLSGLLLAVLALGTLMAAWWREGR
jgi:hypothetical protein